MGFYGRLLGLIKEIRNWFLRREEEARYIQSFRDWIEKEGYTKKADLDTRTTRAHRKKRNRKED